MTVVRLSAPRSGQAATLRQDGRCNVTECHRPGTDAHHPEPWAKGGRTSIGSLEMLCPRHHTLVEQGFSYPRRT